MKFLFFSAIFAVLLFAFDSTAAIITVTTLDDTNDSVCDAHCSLREAIDHAAGGDTVVFARDLRGGTIRLASTLLIQRRITIDGPNKRRITLMGDNNYRIIEVRTDGTSSMVISLDGLIIRDGQAVGSDGGGILLNGSSLLNLTNIAILNCTAQRGGAIYMPANARLFLSDSTIAGNTATGDTLTAGGIDTFMATVWITNSTISGNRLTAAGDGAGGLLLTQPENWFIRNSTIAFNSSNGTSWRSAGGLVALNGTPGPLSNTILAKNSGLNPDFYGRSGGSYNIVGISEQFANGASGNIVGTIDNPVDPQIAPLAENGGGLPTHALLPNSLAVNSGDNRIATDRSGRALLIDQRGFARIADTTVDRGAYEFNAPLLAANSTVSGRVTTASGRGISGARVLLRDAKGETRIALTNSSGFYNFANVPANVSYALAIFDKRYVFAAPENVLIEEANEYVDFQANK